MKIIFLITTVIFAFIGFYGSFIGTINFFSSRSYYREYSSKTKTIFLVVFLVGIAGSVIVAIQMIGGSTQKEETVVKMNESIQKTPTNIIQRKVPDTVHRKTNTVYNRGIQLVAIDTSNVKNAGEERNNRDVNPSERLPRPGYAALLIRVMKKPSGHFISYLLDRHYRSTIWGVWDSNSFSPQEERLELTPEPHHIVFSDGFGSIDSINVLLKSGRFYIKYLRHPYPFGELLRRLKIVPTMKNKIRKISIKSLQTDSVINCTLKNTQQSFLLSEGEYDCDVTPVNPTPLEHRTSERVQIGIGHIKLLPVD